MRRKIDEENFDEAFAQAYRAWTPTVVPSDITAIFDDDALQQPLTSLSTHSAIFFHLVAALKKFASEPPHTLPLTSTLPDMKADTNGYIHLQTLYKRQAEAEKARFRSLIGPELVVDDDTVDEFARNAHGLRLLRGKPFGALDKDQTALGKATTTKFSTCHSYNLRPLSVGAVCFTERSCDSFGVISVIRCLSPKLTAKRHGRKS